MQELTQRQQIAAIYRIARGTGASKPQAIKTAIATVKALKSRAI